MDLRSSVEPLTREHVDLSRYSKRLPVKVVTVVGGGDNVAALGGLCQGYFVSYVSTGGGATLELWQAISCLVSRPLKTLAPPVAARLAPPVGTAGQLWLHLWHLSLGSCRIIRM
jgi:hypothetical protein